MSASENPIPNERRCIEGTMMFGSSTNFRDACRLMDAAHEGGVTLFDTAEMYPVPQSAATQGLSEVFLGKWLRSKFRDRICVSTKAAGPSGKMTWIRAGPPSVNRTNIRAALEGSLQRLRTDYIDIYYIHWPDRYVPCFGDTDFDPISSFEYVTFEEQYSALRDCVEEGKVRYVGLSNETPFGVMKFSQLAQANHERPKIHCLQNAYSLLCRTFDSGLAECCHEEDIRLHAYSPLAMGMLTGKYRDGGTPEARFNRYRHKYPEMEYRYRTKPNIDSAVEQYASLAESAGMMPTEMALRFVLDHPLVETAVVGASSESQLRENLIVAEKGPLEQDLRDSIDKIHLAIPNPAP